MDRFNGQSILQAISELFATSGYGGGKRLAADALLRDFSKADCVVPVSFELLHSHVCGQTQLPEEALQLLATGPVRPVQEVGFPHRGSSRVNHRGLTQGSQGSQGSEGCVVVTR